jgi:O-antigen/teichoic acid export membrane protein
MNTTAPPMPPEEAQQKKDVEHLRLLSVFHFVFAGFALLGLGFMVLHYTFMRMFLGPEFARYHRGSPPPKEVLVILAVVYVVIGFFTILGLVLNLLSGVWLRQRKNRLFSLIIAGLNCLQVPLGTALGVFTFIVLSRDSVRRLYEGPDGFQ